MSLTFQDITDQVAKESSDSTASDHHTHQVDTGAKEGKETDRAKATVIDHTSTPGPVQTDQLPEKKGKEELKARAAELNK